MTPAEAIAAEVAAKYGVPVSPSVVKVLPPRTATPVDYVWNGHQLVGREPPRAKMKAQIHADASRKNSTEIANKVRAQNLAKRVEAVRAFADQGMTAREIAAQFEGMTAGGMRQFMNRNNITYKREGLK